MNVDTIINERVYNFLAYVESETQKGMFYRVKNTGEGFSCTCPNFTNKNKECKHIVACKNEL